MKEARIMAKAIMEAHDGQAYFNIQQAAKIVGCGRNTMITMLTDAGILVKRVGPSKRVSALDLASVMTQQRVIPYYTTKGA